MKLAEWMTLHGKDDVWVATQAKVNRVTINRIRREKKRPSMELADKIRTITNGDVPADSYLSRFKPMQAAE